MKRSVILGVTAVALLLLAACGSSDRHDAVTDQPEATNSVEAVKSYRFSPANITIASGETVTWTNNDNFVHNIHILGPGETTKALRIGGSASITFNDAGLFKYECSLHPALMKGTVQVT